MVTLDGRHEERPRSFYIDGHVRVYYGEQTKLPHHYVARQKLCLRATDYWVNARDGQPILVINKPIDPGLLKVLEHDMNLSHYIPTSKYFSRNLLREIWRVPW